MKKQAKLLKKGDKIVMAGRKLVIREIEFSDVGKQGVKKCRIVAVDEKGESVTIVRPDNYPFEAE